MKERMTQTVALRLPPKLHREIVSHKQKGERLSDTVRRLLSLAVSRVPSEGGK